MVRRHATTQGEALRLTVCGLVALPILGALACAASAAIPDATCSPVRGERSALGPEALARLAGEYRLVLVNSRGEYGDSVILGTLTLWPNDSVRRYAWMVPAIGRLRGERPLAGQFTTQSSTVPNYPNEWEPATAENPVVELIGSTIYFGGIDAMDGSGERLLIGTATAAGFSGTWEHDGGIARVMDTVHKRFLQDPGGHFCASRTGEGRSRGLSVVRRQPTLR
jgi:hypothetical protein